VRALDASTSRMRSNSRARKTAACMEAPREQQGSL
jgi:hypothetical protein